MKRISVFVLTAVLLGTTAVAGTLRVSGDSDAADPDGSNWARAYPTIAAAVKAVETYSVTSPEIWVAKGRYDEARDTETGALELRHGVKVYGGFAGNEVLRNQRDWGANETIIDGSKARDGSPAYHVVLAVEDDGAVLDGFTITGGLADGNFEDDANPRFSGGGLLCYEVDITIANCIFAGNKARDGGAIAALGGASPAVSNTRFVDNTGVTGGALYLETGTPDIEACFFERNEATDAGGAAYLNSCDAQFVNCVFWDNTAIDGAGIYSDDSSPNVINCTFTDNEASGQGGAFHNAEGSTPTIKNSILWENLPQEIFSGTTSQVTVTACNVEGGYTGTLNIDEDPLFVDPDNGDLRLQEDSPCIGAGTISGAPRTDIEGNSRSLSSITIGAYTVETGGEGEGEGEGEGDEGQAWLTLLLGAAVALLGIIAGGAGGGGGGGSACFIASAAYGTPLADQVDTLRMLRDVFMMDNAVGVAFVDTYYRISPAIADVVAQYPALAFVVRLLLTPVILVGRLMLAGFGALWVGALLMSGLFFMRRSRGRARHRTGEQGE